jgi:hypothetical protein
MRTFIVAYDLSSPDARRSAEGRSHVSDAIMRLADQWARPLDNVWYLRSDLAAVEIEAKLAQALAEDDALMVQETRGEAQLANTGLRWFRRRAVADTVVPFPGPLDRAPQPGQHATQRMAG